MYYRSGKLRKDETRRYDLGLARFRRDGFASLDAGDAPGTVITRPLTFPGRRLFVNADVADGGYALIPEARAVCSRTLPRQHVETSHPTDADQLFERRAPVDGPQHFVVLTPDGAAIVHAASYRCSGTVRSESEYGLAG